MIEIVTVSARTVIPLACVIVDTDLAAQCDGVSFLYVLGNSLTDWCSMVSRSGGEDAVGRQRKWDTRGGRKTREIWGGVSSLDEVEHFR